MHIDNPQHINQLVKSMPVYRELYGTAIDDFDIASNWFRYPTLEKKHIVKNFPNNFMTPQLQQAMAAGALEFNASSGTTSERMQIVRKRLWWADENRNTYAFDEKLAPFCGDHKKAVLTTAICSNTVCFAKLPSYEERIMGKTFYLNISPDPNQWNEADIRRMIDEINRYQADIFDVDPIYLALMLHKMEIYGIHEPIHQPKVLIFTYEFVTAYSKQFIRRHFPQVPSIIFYGSTETGYNLFEMPDGRFKHVQERSRVDLEHLRDDVYFIKTSSWKNEYMPLINYRIGDLVRVSPEHLPLWSNDNPQPGPRIVDQLCGRFFDISEASDGRLICVGDVEREMIALAAPILHYQLRFVSASQCRVRYISTDGADLNQGQQNELLQRMQALYGDKIAFELVHEKSIAPEMSGKFCLVKKG